MCIVLYTNNSLMSPKSTRPQISEIPLQLSALLFPPGWFNSKNWREGKLGEVWKNHHHHQRQQQQQSTKHKAQSTKHKAQSTKANEHPILLPPFYVWIFRDAFFEIYLTPHEPVNKIHIRQNQGHFGTAKWTLWCSIYPARHLHTITPKYSPNSIVYVRLGIYIYIHMIYTCPTHLVWMYDILSIYCKRTVYVHLDTKTLQNEFALYHWGFPHPIHFHHQKLYIELKVDSGPAQIFCMTWFIPRHPFTPLEDVFGATKHT